MVLKSTEKTLINEEMDDNEEGKAKILKKATNEKKTNESSNHSNESPKRPPPKGTVQKKEPIKQDDEEEEEEEEEEDEDDEGDDDLEPDSEEEENSPVNKINESSSDDTKKRKIDHNQNSSNKLPKTTNPKHQHELFLANLPYDASADQVKTLCEEFGKVSNFEWKTDISGVFKGFAYVAYANEEDAEKALNGLCQKQLNGRQIRAERTMGKNARRNSSIVPTTTVFAGNLPSDVTVEEIKDFFSASGNIQDIRFVNTVTGEFKRCAFIEFSDVISASKAVELPKPAIRENTLKLDFASPFEKNLTGFRRGGRGGFPRGFARGGRGGIIRGVGRGGRGGRGGIIRGVGRGGRAGRGGRGRGK